MDSSTVISFPRAGSGADAGEPDAEIGRESLVEVDAAIAMVALGAARRVRLTALPFAEAIAPVGLAHARAAGIEFRLERADRAGVRTITIGPREAADRP